jgi:hypothetical protein
MLQVLRKEQAMSEDSAFLKGQMEALLKVSAMFPARGLHASLAFARSPPF